MSDDFEDDDLEDDQYDLSSTDLPVVRVAIRLLEKILRSSLATPAKTVAVSDALRMLKRLPNSSDELNLNITLTGPRRFFQGDGEEHEIYHWWEIEIEETLITITAGGYFFRRSTGGDSFIAMRWCAQPGCETDHTDNLRHLRLVDDAQPFDREVMQIDLSEPGYSLTILFDGDPLMDDEAEDDVDEEFDSDTMDEDEFDDVNDDDVSEAEDGSEQLDDGSASRVKVNAPELGVCLWAFLDLDVQLIYALAGRAYWLAGDDEAKLKTLEELSRSDFQSAVRTNVPNRFAVITGDGTRRGGFATPRAVIDPGAGLFEELLTNIEKQLPAVPNFRGGPPIPTKLPDDLLGVRTIVAEDAAGNCRAIVTEEDQQWLASRMCSDSLSALDESDL